jgi:uncharacterized protein YoxC
MNTDMVICVCLIIITAALVVLIAAMIFILLEVRRLGKLTENLITHLKTGVNPVLTMLTKVSQDVAGVTDTVRVQVERVDVVADQIGKSLLSLVDTYAKTGYVLHNAIAEPLIDLAAFMKGLSRTFNFFFFDRKR